MSMLECRFECRNILGEGPTWSALEGVLYWFDIMRNEIHRYDPNSGTHRNWKTEQKLHAAALCTDGTMIVTAHRLGFARYTPGGALTSAFAPPTELFLNDIKCDRRGRLWAGTTRRKGVESDAQLYRLDADFSCHEMERGLHTANGVAWSPDDRTMYLVDTYGGGILAYDFDIDDGAISNRRVLVSPGGLGGLPDGLTIDAEGCIWCAFALGGAVYRFTPAGRVDRKVDIPAKFPTSCIFGGPNLETLFITSATAGRSESELRDFPLSGSLFSIEPGVRGIPETLFKVEKNGAREHA
jgi:sugar lactone lactonase YvrE